MALAGSEVYRNGFVRDATTLALITTTNQVGATRAGGFLRDPDGRLVVVYA